MPWANNLLPFLIIGGAAPGVSEGIFIYTGAPAAGNAPIYELVPSGITTDPSGNNMVGNGKTSAIETSMSDATAITVTGALLTIVSATYPILASNPNVGTVYRVTFAAVGQMGAVAVAFSFVCSIDGGLTMDITFPATALNANDHFQLTGYIEIPWTAVGAGGNCDLFAQVILTDTTTGNSDAVAAADITNAFNTTVAHTLNLQWQWGGVSAGRTVTFYYSTFIRIGV